MVREYLCRRCLATVTVAADAVTPNLAGLEHERPDGVGPCDSRRSWSLVVAGQEVQRAAV